MLAACHQEKLCRPVRLYTRAARGRTRLVWQPDSHDERGGKAKDVIDLHGMLLQSTKFPIYNAEYYKVLPFIVELRQRGDKDLNEIETCLDALYGVMMLRLQKKEITPETERAIKEITVFIGLLSDYYIKDRTEGLKFDDDDM